MAKRKADELEDFTGKLEQQHTQCSKEQITEGSILLKRLLLEWKDKVDGGSMSSEEMREELMKLISGPYKESFENDPFFQAVKAL
jgi:DNA mismatch repair protein MSH2